jgi:hypothetical protein
LGKDADEMGKLYDIIDKFFEEGREGGTNTIIL